MCQRKSLGNLEKLLKIFEECKEKFFKELQLEFVKCRIPIGFQETIVD